MEKPLMSQPIEYLSASIGEHGTTGEEVVILTIRPDGWRPHNIGITKPQGERLLKDLQRLLPITPLS